VGWPAEPPSLPKRPGGAAKNLSTKSESSKAADGRSAVPFGDDLFFSSNGVKSDGKGWKRMEKEVYTTGNSI